MTNTPKTFITRESQSQYDLAIQLFGRFDQIGKILANLPTLNNIVPTGTSLSYDQQDTQDAIFFTAVLISTWDARGITFIDTETGFKILTETGDGILIE